MEERIGDGEDYVVELFEVLRLDPALEEDPDVGVACVAAEASDEVVAFLCGIIVAWCALVLDYLLRASIPRALLSFNLRLGGAQTGKLTPVYLLT